MNPPQSGQEVDLALPALPDSALIPTDVVTLIPYGLARRLKAVAIDATGGGMTVLMTPSADPDTIAELESASGRRVVPVEASPRDIENLLDRLSGSLDTQDLWLQARHIQALSRLVDHSANVGQIDGVRSLVDRALQFAPYSSELWLMRARVADHRRDVVHALTVASQIAPNDRRVLRWIHSLQDMDEPDQSPHLEESRDDGAPEAELLAAPPVSPTTSGGSEGGVDAELASGAEEKHAETVVKDEALDRSPAQPESPKREEGQEATSIAVAVLEAARTISRIRDLQELLRFTAECLESISDAASVTCFLRTGRGWTGWSTSPQLQSQLARALPKENRLSSQVVRQGLPIVITDTSTRLDDVGNLIHDTGIRSFALLPIRTNGQVGGLAYLNYTSPDQANQIFDSDLARGVELVLNCAGTSAMAIQQKQKLLDTAAVDGLTGAYTIQQFERMLGAEIERARRYRFSVSVLSLDVDDFSRVNELIGNEGGDEALRQVAARLVMVERTSDVLARKSDDEFLLMLPQTTGKGAEIVASRIHRSFEDPLPIESKKLAITVSIGMATFPEQAEGAGTLLNAAEIALFAAKAHGKQRTSVADTLSLSG